RPLQFFVHRRPHLVDLLGIVLLQFFQANIDNRANTLERLAKLLALTFRSGCAFLTVPRKFVTKSAIKQLQTPDQFILNFGAGAGAAAVSSSEKENNRGQQSASSQTNDHINEGTH